MATAEEKRSEAIAEKVFKKFQRLSGGRSNFEAQWQQIAERMVPSQSSKFTAGAKSGRGEVRTSLVYDSTAVVALGRFAAILDSLLTPRSQKWHTMKASDTSLNNKRRVQLWFEEANAVLFKYRYAPKANFASQNHKNFRALGAYGSGSMFIDRLAKEPGLRYKSTHLSETYFAENHQGIVDQVIRHFPLSARQAFQKWGNALPERIKASLETNPDAEFFFLHCVEPREDQDPGRVDFMGMEYASYTVSVEGKKLISEGGFPSFPYAISRYDQDDNEVYGRSPAMEVLPEVKGLNEMKKAMLKQGHRALDPVLLGYDDGILDTLSLTPGAYNAGGVTADGRPLIHTLPTGQLAAGKDQMDDGKAVVNDAFLVTLFSVLMETPQMTATEVLERAKEKGILLTPNVGRQQSEYLGPMVEREVDLLVEQGLMPPMPPELMEARGEYTIEYDSPLTRAQKAEEASGLMRSLEMSLQVVNITQNPEPLDFYDFDVITPEIMAIQGVPYRWSKSLEQVAAIREGRAKQQQQETAIQAAPAAAAMMKAQAVAKKAGGK